jgi:predicted DNA-binding transcriptional regulator YafY
MLTPRQEQIRDILLHHHQGRYRPITAKMLSRALGMPYGRTSERCIQKDVEALRQATVPICAAVNAPYGYYWGMTREDFRQYEAQAVAKATHVLANLRLVLGSPERFRDAMRQLSLEIGGGQV